MSSWFINLSIDILLWKWRASIFGWIFVMYGAEKATLMPSSMSAKNKWIVETWRHQSKAIVIPSKSSEKNNRECFIAILTFAFVNRRIMNTESKSVPHSHNPHISTDFISFSLHLVEWLNVFFFSLRMRTSSFFRWYIFELMCRRVVHMLDVGCWCVNKQSMKLYYTQHNHTTYICQYVSDIIIF